MQPRPKAELAGVPQKDQKLAESAWRPHVEYAHIEHILGTKISGGRPASQGYPQFEQIGI
jgi:hypothetical protein